MPTEHQPDKMSLDACLLLQGEIGIKHAYIDGDVFTMAGGSRRHNTIATNCAADLREAYLDVTFS